MAPGILAALSLVLLAGFRLEVSGSQASPPVTQPAVYFNFANKIPLKLYSNYLCAKFNLGKTCAAPNATSPTLLTRLMAWFQTTTSTPPSPLEIFQALRTLLLLGLTDDQASRLRSILSTSFDAGDLQTLLGAVFDAKYGLALNAYTTAKVFYGSRHCSIAGDLADRDKRRLLADLVLTANGRGRCPRCGVNYNTAGQIIRVLFTNLVVKDCTSDTQTNDAVAAMIFLGEESLTVQDIIGILDSVARDYLTKDSLAYYIRQESASYSPGHTRIHYRQSDPDEYFNKTICHELQKYVTNSRYCGVRLTAKLLSSSLECDEDGSTTTVRPRRRTTTPPVTTTTTTSPTTTTTSTTTPTSTVPTTTTTTPTTTHTTTTTTSTPTAPTSTPATTTTSTPTTPTSTPTTTTTPTTTPPTTTRTSTPTTPTSTPTTTTVTSTPTPTTTPTTTTTTPTTTTTTSIAPSSCGVSGAAAPATLAKNSGPIITPFIVGGSDGGSCSVYPWIVRLFVDGQFCGGAILDATHVLTAAHCVINKNVIRAYVGDYDSTNPEPTEQSFDVHVETGLAIHPDFDYIARTNDIAILTLDTPIDLQRECAGAVCLNPNYNVQNGQSCQIAGWGMTDENSFTPAQILQTVSVPTYEGTDCLTTFPQSGATYLSDPTNQLCAGSTSGGVDACGGDSGGPLFCLDGATNTWVAVGVISYGEGCARPEYPGAYAKINAYYDWIQEQL